MHDYVLFMANTGLRPDEAARLEFRDVTAVKDDSTREMILEIEVRGKRGVVMRDHGAFVFPDTNAQLKGEKPQHVYSVMFEAGELWGDAEFPNDKLLIDMFEDYLRPADGK